LRTWSTTLDDAIRRRDLSPERGEFIANHRRAWDLRGARGLVNRATAFDGDFLIWFGEVRPRKQSFFGFDTRPPWETGGDTGHTRGEEAHIAGQELVLGVSDPLPAIRRLF